MRSSQKESKKKEKRKRSMSLSRRIVLGVLGVSAAVGLSYLAYHVIHYTLYDRYQDFLTSYEYEPGSEFRPVEEAGSDVPGMRLVCENEFLKLYTDTETAEVAVYDKRDGSVTYSNPPGVEEDAVANEANLNFLKSQFMLTYYNSDGTQGTLDSYSQSVSRGQFRAEGLKDGVRYLYRVGSEKNADGAQGAYFDLALEYRLDQDSLVVSVPVCAIREYGAGGVGRIQLLRMMGAGHASEDGYLVVPNGSGSLIDFNNGKTSAPNYSQYIYDIDPLAATYYTTENINGAKLPIYGICREDRSLLATVEQGASTALLTAGISGVYNEYNYVYPTFVLRNIDNLSMFGDSNTDVYVLESGAYDINLTVRYSFLTKEYKGYPGIANYYRERLIDQGVLTPIDESGDIPLYVDVISGVKEHSHFLGVQYLHTFSMTTFQQAGQISDDLAENGVASQVMNLQGWFNGGYYHDTADRIKVMRKLGGRSGLEKLKEVVSNNNGRLYVDVAFQRVTCADDSFDYNTEGARYYGTGYIASFGQVNPATLRNTSSLGYSETAYDLISPKYLPRYVEGFAGEIQKLDVGGVSLRDLGNVLCSDKKRTNVINREEALQVVKGQLETLRATGKELMANAANAYAFGYAADIVNVPITDNDYVIIDQEIPLYEMIIHGSISYATELLNYQDEEDMTPALLKAVEAGACPHYVFTWEPSSDMKDTGLNRYYATTYENWKREAIEVYRRMNDILKHVSNAAVIDHEILAEDVRKVTYDNGVVIYINYSAQTQTADGLQIPALSCRLEGI